MNNAADKKRLNYVDMMKGIATIIVVCYHLLAPSAFKNRFIDHMLFPLLASFFLFAGYFHKPGKRSFGENVKIRAKALLIPFVKYGVLFWFIGSVYLVLSKQETVFEALCCLRNFFAGCIWNRVIQGWFGWNYYKLGSRYMFLAGFWFLPALFFATILFLPIADRTTKSKGKTCAAVLLLFALTAVLRALKVDLPYNLQIVPFWAAFMLLGLFAREQQLFELPALSGGKGWISGMAVLAAGLAIALLREPVLNTFRGYFPEPEVISMILSIIFSLMVIWGLTMVCRLVEEAGIRVKELAWIGSNSMTIYLFHYFFAWGISIISGFSLRYAAPVPADVVWKSALVALGAFLLSVLYAVIVNRPENKQSEGK